MTLASDLLAQASDLAVLDGTRPKQASLRRALSAAYYSLFHLLINDAILLLSPAPSFNPFVARVLDHAKARAAATWITSATSSSRQPVDRVLQFPIAADLTMFCGTFISLQQLRHRADYDVDYRVTRTECLMELGRVDAAHLAWRRQRQSSNARAFLLRALDLLKVRA
jgi:hypothetical protein